MIIGTGLSHVLGADGRSWYDFWSGFGADLGQIALVGAAVGIYRKHNCHVKGCWRIGKQPLEHDGATWMVCHKHHPADQLTSATMKGLAEQKRARDGQQTAVTLTGSTDGERAS